MRNDQGLVGRLVSNPGFLENLLGNRDAFFRFLKITPEDDDGLDSLLGLMNAGSDGAALMPERSADGMRLERLLADEKRSANLFRQQPDLVESLLANGAMVEQLRHRPKVYQALLAKAREHFVGDNELQRLIKVAQCELPAGFTAEGAISNAHTLIWLEKGRDLLEAVRDGKADEVRQLLEAGADPNWRWDGDRPPMVTAVQRGELEILYKTPLTMAVQRGELQLAHLLLDSGADPNWPAACDRTPLQEAALQGNLDIVQLLLHRGADPLLGAHDGGLPREYAARRGHLAVVKA